MSEWYVYMVRCVDNSLYTGIAKDVSKRVHEHNNDNRLGAKYTRARRPVELVFEQGFTSRSLACKAESSIKAMKKQEKEKIIAGQLCVTE